MTISINDLDNQRITASLTIPNGQAVSQSLDLQGWNLVGLIWPAAWTAASLGLQGSVDGVNFFPMFDNSRTPLLLGDGSSVSGISMGIGAPDIPSLISNTTRFIKLWSNTGGVSTNQGAARVFTALLEPNPNRKP